IEPYSQRLTILTHIRNSLIHTHYFTHLAHGLPSRSDSEVVNDQRRHGEEGAYKPKRRPEDQGAGQGTQNGAGNQPQPRRDSPDEIQPRGHVGAGGEEHAMTERELAAEAGDDVPGDGKAGEQVRVDEDIQPEPIAGESGK